MKKTITIILILIVVGFGVYFIASNNKSVTSVNNSQTSTTTTAPLTTIFISIKNFSFAPATLTIKTGTKITWTNNDSIAHTVTSDSDNLLNSPILSPGESFSFTFTKVNSTNYHCAIHPMMEGKVIVQN